MNRINESKIKETGKKEAKIKRTEVEKETEKIVTGEIIIEAGPEIEIGIMNAADDPGHVIGHMGDIIAIEAVMTGTGITEVGDAKNLIKLQHLHCTYASAYSYTYLRLKF